MKSIFLDTQTLKLLPLGLVPSLLLGGMYLIHVAIDDTEYRCEFETVNVIPSPDDVWLASVRIYICSGWFYASTAMGNVVQLIRQEDMMVDQNVVLSIDTNRPAEEEPSVRWLEARKLQVTLPNTSASFVRMHKLEGVEIVYKHVPDDPVDRARYRQERGLPPE